MLGRGGVDSRLVGDERLRSRAAYAHSGVWCPHTKIESQEGLVEWEALAERLMQRERVIGAAPYVEQQGMFSAGGRNQGAMVNGIHPDWEDRVSIIGEHMRQGGVGRSRARRVECRVGLYACASVGRGSRGPCDVAGA